MTHTVVLFHWIKNEYENGAETSAGFSASNHPATPTRCLSTQLFLEKADDDWPYLQV